MAEDGGESRDWAEMPSDALAAVFGKLDVIDLLTGAGGRGGVPRVAPARGDRPHSVAPRGIEQPGQSHGEREGRGHGAHSGRPRRWHHGGLLG
ncbi:hypothetical protein ABZP36_033122 [Zizania latifolia]